MATEVQPTGANGAPIPDGSVSARPRDADRGRAAADREAEPWRGHIPALDGVRGLAIALVMLGHIMGRSAPTVFAERGIVQVARGGWIGVDLFFVLSGFLITGILLDARGGPHYFRNFYVRRTLRIFPLYYAILIAVFFVAPLAVAGVRDQNWFTAIGQNQVWFWTYTSNILLAIEGTWRATGTLGHFWSLAIEEQFYLVWPAVVLVLSPLQLRKACGVILVAALGLRFVIALTAAPDLGAFTLMPARADTLVAGAWLATALRTGVQLSTIRKYAAWVLAMSLVAVAALFIRYRGLSEADFLTETIGFTCLALGFAALLVLALDASWRPSFLGQVFRHPTLRMLGKYSYAMYCFHPLIQDALRSMGVHAGAVPAVGGLVLPGVFAYGALVVTLTLAASYASWNLLEKHFLRQKERFTARRDGDAPRRAEHSAESSPGASRAAEPRAMPVQPQ